MATPAAFCEAVSGRPGDPMKPVANSAAEARPAAAKNGHTAGSSHRPERSSTLFENRNAGPLVNTTTMAATDATPQEAGHRGLKPHGRSRRQS